MSQRYQDRCFSFQGVIFVTLSGEYEFQNSKAIRNHAKISYISISVEGNGAEARMHRPRS